MSTISSLSLLNSATATSMSPLLQAAQSIINESTGNSTSVSSLASTLANAKTAAQTAALSARQTSDNTSLSAYGSLNSVLSALQASVKSLANGTTSLSLGATASGKGLDPAVVSGAVAGTYTVAVSQIASAQSLTSAAFGTSARLGTGTMTITAGGKSMNIAVDSTNNTLDGIADAINKAGNNPGVTATVVTSTDGAHLVLQSTATGAGNTISVATSNVRNDMGLSSLGVTSTTGANGKASTIASSSPTQAWQQTNAAQDARFNIGGIASSSSTNAVTGAIAGVTLTLSSASVGTTQTVQVSPGTASQNTASQSAAITNFVSLYNNAVTTINKLSSYDKTSNSAGALQGDPAVTTVKSALSSIVLAGSGTSPGGLGSIGITVSSDGTLAVNQATLTKALASNPTGVAALFSSTNGVAC